MKTQYLILTLAIGLMVRATAQTTITDSIQTGGGYANDVYYSLETGVVKEVGNNDWQLAFSVGEYNVGVRANTTTGSAGNGQVSVYEMPDTDTIQWTVFDTTGYKTNWALLNNSDEDWQQGALNQNATGQLDYGWGVYDPSTHVINGHRLYLAVVTSGTSTVYKKIWIVNKTAGTWNIRFANLDGSDAHDLALASADYSDKNFIYLSLVGDSIVDREPLRNSWDFMLTRYAAWQPDQSIYYPSAGILTNTGVLTSEVRDKDETTTTLADTTVFSGNISAIGADWKQFSSQTFAFYTVDSLSYFVKATDGAYWKLVFTDFKSGSSATGTGRTVFNKTRLTPSTGLFSLGGKLKNVSVYPNPANDVLHVLFESTTDQSVVTITDIMGRQVYHQDITSSAFTHQQIDVSGFTKGVYLLNINSGNDYTIQKILVN